MASADFAQKLGLVLKAINLSRGRLAQTAGVDKSVVSRWASGVQAPSDHNLSLLTQAVARHRPGFGRRDWDLDAERFANRLDAPASRALIRLAKRAASRSQSRRAKPGRWRATASVSRDRL